MMKRKGMKTFYHLPGGSQYAEPGETRKGDGWTGRVERDNRCKESIQAIRNIS